MWNRISISLEYKPSDTRFSFISVCVSPWCVCISVVCVYLHCVCVCISMEEAAALYPVCLSAKYDENSGCEKSHAFLQQVTRGGWVGISAGYPWTLLITTLMQKEGKQSALFETMVFVVMSSRRNDAEGVGRRRITDHLQVSFVSPHSVCVGGCPT